MQGHQTSTVNEIAQGGLSAPDTWSQWLMAQAPAIVIAALVIVYLLRRNAALSEALVENVRANSDERSKQMKEHGDERLQLTLAHAKERDSLQTRSLLEHDATLRHIFHSFERGLEKMLSALASSSRSSTEE